MLKHDSWNEMYCLKARGMSIWTIKQNLWVSDWGIWVVACIMTVYTKYQNEQLNMKLMNMNNGTHNDILKMIQ